MGSLIPLDHYSRRVVDMIKEEVLLHDSKEEFCISDPTVDKINRIYKLSSTYGQKTLIELSTILTQRLPVENVFFKFDEPEEGCRIQLSIIAIKKA